MNKLTNHIHEARTWTLVDNKNQHWRGLGLNFCWESRDLDDSAHFSALHQHPRFDYATQIPQLAAQGINFIRVWMCWWNLCLDWPRPENNKRCTEAPEGSRFNPEGGRALQDLLRLCEAHGIRIMLCLEAHINFMGRGWELSPYNMANGGPARTAREFFALPEARALYKEKLDEVYRLVGTSPALAVWEFFNEIDNLVWAPDFGGSPQDPAVLDWHQEMARHLAALDTYKRPISTSISHREIPGLWDLPELSVNQHHVYRHSRSIPGELSRNVKRHRKAHVLGEFGYHWDWSLNFADLEPAFSNDLILGLYLGLLSPTPILPLTWWWEYFEDRGLLGVFKHLAEVNKEMLELGAGTFTSCPTPRIRGWIFHTVKTGSRYWTLAHRRAKKVGGDRRLPLDFLAGEIKYLNPLTGNWTCHGKGESLPLETVGQGETRLFTYTKKSP